MPAHVDPHHSPWARHDNQSYPQKLSTGPPVSRETRRRWPAHPVDTAVDEPNSIGHVSRETASRKFPQQPYAQLVDRADPRYRPVCDGLPLASSQSLPHEQGAGRIGLPTAGLGRPFKAAQRPHGRLFHVKRSGLRAPGSGLRAPGSGLRAPGSGLRAPGSGLRAPGSEGLSIGTALVSRETWEVFNTVAKAPVTRAGHQARDGAEVLQTNALSASNAACRGSRPAINPAVIRAPSWSEPPARRHYFEPASRAHQPPGVAPAASVSVQAAPCASRRLTWT
jgi:hypothetical protein